MDRGSTHLSTVIPQVSKTEQVVDRLIAYFKDADVKPGDVIPTELSLTTTLGVSRPIIREALSHLKLLGLVEARKKRGMILSEPRLESTLEKLLLPKLLEGNRRQDIFELRLMLEIGIADTLFAHIRAEDIIQLEEIIKDEERLLSTRSRSKKEIDRLVAIDAAFHSYLYKITNNSILQSLQDVILPTIKYVIAHQLDMDALSYGAVSHGQLIDILKTGTIDEFRLGMRAHLDLHFSAIYKNQNIKK